MTEAEVDPGPATAETIGGLTYMTAVELRKLARRERLGITYLDQRKKEQLVGLVETGLRAKLGL